MGDAVLASTVGGTQGLEALASLRVNNHEGTETEATVMVGRVPSGSAPAVATFFAKVLRKGEGVVQSILLGTECIAVTCRGAKQPETIIAALAYRVHRQAGGALILYIPLMATDDAPAAPDGLSGAWSGTDLAASACRAGHGLRRLLMQLCKGKATELAGGQQVFIEMQPEATYAAWFENECGFESVAMLSCAEPLRKCTALRWPPLGNEAAGDVYDAYSEEDHGTAPGGGTSAVNARASCVLTIDTLLQLRPEDSVLWIGTRKGAELLAMARKYPRCTFVGLEVSKEVGGFERTQ